MKPEIRQALLDMAEAFQDFLNIDTLDLVDITVSGSNAAYTYTPHSDIDLHLVARTPEGLSKLYLELFDAKKNLYNLVRHQKVKGYDVEFYVQHVDAGVKSMGIYSVLHGRWIDRPQKVAATIDDQSVQSKVSTYEARIKEALRDDDLELAQAAWDDYRNMRRAGLEQGGEFSPENLAFKILRTKGYQQQLWDHLLTLKDQQLSVESLQEKRLDELFDRKSDYFVDKATDSVFRTSKDIGNRKIVFTAASNGEHPDGQGEVWEVDFQEKSLDAPMARGTFGITGSGNEVEVMTMVVASLQEFVSRYAPQAIMFTADADGGRAKLYDRMIARLGTQYTLRKTDRGQSGFNYWLERKA